MARVGIFHPDLTRRGGAVTVAAHIISALKGGHNLTLYTTTDPDFAELNERYGTNLRKDDVSICKISLTSIDLVKKSSSVLNKIFNSNLNLDALKFALIQRHVRSTDSIDEELYISTVNELFINKPSLQYIHFPTFTGGTDSRHISWTPNNLHKIYREVCKTIVGVENMGSSAVLVANSEWTRDVVQDTYDRRVEVVHPPINLEDFNSSTSDREEGFVTVGAIHHRKRQLEMIEIIDGLRSQGFNTHLHIIGGIDNKPYFEKVRKKSEARDYIHLEGYVERSDLVNIIKTHKYGLHGRPNEHFGIGVAEMVAGGAIPFVPSGGGQVEIVNNRPELQYESTDVAVRKIKHVVENPKLQRDLREDLESKSNQYSAKKFKNNILELVNDIAENRSVG
jgi:glycosyltransferase involved in cell wall biosynthesis